MEKNAKRKEKKENIFLKWWKLEIIIITIIGLSAFLIYRTIEEQQFKIKIFQESGYILQATESKVNNNEVQRMNFNANEKYEKNYNAKIEFKDTEGNKIQSNTGNFIHYSDNSIGVFSDSVLLNLDEIEREPIIYYTLTEKNILKKNETAYSIMNLGNELSFDNLILKISENKYLVASQQIGLVFGDGTENKEINGFLEIEYVDNQVLKIYNQELSYQTIASNVEIQLPNNIKINLSDKIILKTDKPVLSLNNMVINSDDNVEIVDLADYEKTEENKENKIENENSSENKENNQGNSQTNNNNTSNNNSQNTNIGNAGNSPNNNTGLGEGSGNTDFVPSVDIGKLQVDEPIFKITNFETTSVKMQADIEIIDEKLLLAGSTKVKIIKNNTNSQVYSSEIAEGQYSSTIIYEGLEANTEYTLEVKAIYKVGDIEYNKTFIYKIFRTNIMGVELEKEIFTSSSLSFKVDFKQDTGVQSALVQLTDLDGRLIEQFTVTPNGQKIITFPGLQNNTTYSVSIKDVVMDNVKFGNTSYIEQFTTLKQSPVISATPEFGYDERNNRINLKLNNILDKDKGIKSYTFRVYKESDYKKTDKKVIAEIKTSTPETVIKVDKKEMNEHGEEIEIKGDINRNTEYYFEVTIEFYDNEKYQEFVSNRSGIMNFDKIQMPTLKFNEAIDENEKTLVTFESIQGEIQIDDPGKIIDPNLDSIRINYFSALGDKKTINSNITTKVPININSLNSNTTYQFEVILLKNKVDSIYLGSVYVNTTIPKNLKLILLNQTSDITNKFNVNLSVFNNIEELELKTLDSIKIELYRANTVVSNEGVVSLKKHGNAIGICNIKDMNSDFYISEIAENMVNNRLDIIPSSFVSSTNSSKKLTNDDIIDNQYIIEVVQAKDYVGNEIGLQNNRIEIMETNYIAPIGPQGEETKDALNIDAITKKARENSQIYINNLAETIDHAKLLESTNIGYAVYPKTSYDVSTVKEVTYRVYETDAYGNVTTTLQEVIIDENTIKERILSRQSNDEVLTAYFKIGNYNDKVTDSTILERGSTYKFEYDIVLYGEETGVEIILPSQEQIDNNVKYFSISSAVPKQLPDISMYIESLNVDSVMELKYKTSDIDQAMIKFVEDKELELNNDETTRNFQLVKNTQDYQTIIIDNLKKGNVEFNIKYKTIGRELEIIKKLIEFEYNGYIDFEGVTVGVSEYDKNRLQLSINGLMDEAKKSIYSINTTYTKNDISYTFNNVDLLSNNTIMINYIELIKALGTTNLSNIEIKSELFYDAQIIDFRKSSIADTIILEDIDGNFYKYDNKENNLKTTEIITEAIELRIVQLTENSLMMKDENSNEINIPITITDKGILYNNKVIYAKKINVKNIKNDNITIENSNIPISMYNVGNDAYSTFMNSYELKFNIEGKIVSNEQQEVNKEKIHVEYAKIDSSGGVIEGETWKNEVIENYNKETKEASINLKNLVPGTRYGYKIYYDNNGIKEYIYDTDLNKSENIYIFATLGVVKINDVKFELNNGLDTATLSYNIVDGTTDGYIIEYILYENGKPKTKQNEKSYIDPTTEIYTTNDVVVNTVEGESRIIFDKEYKYRITFIIKSLNGEEITRIEHKEEFIFTPGIPSLNITAVRTDGNNSINPDIIITPTLITGQYDFVGKKLDIIMKNVGTNTKIYEENVDIVKNQLSRIILDNSTGIYKTDGIYQLEAKINFDRNNDGIIDSNEYISSDYILEPIQNDIDIGEVSIKEYADGKLYIQFKDSLNLGKITKITYTINTMGAKDIIIDPEKGIAFGTDTLDPTIKYLLLESADPYVADNNRITIAGFTQVLNEETEDETDTKEKMVFNSITINW